MEAAGQQGGALKQSARRKAPLKQARAYKTREHLLDIAGHLLAEVGIERISTNLICARAEVTPPTCYYHFKDKYAVIEALGHRLMERQNAVLRQWLARHASRNSLEDNFEELILETLRVTEAEPGGVWIGRALHAAPRLIHIRLESHRAITDSVANAYRTSFPDLSRDLLWRRARVMIEFGYAICEMLSEEDRIPRADMISEVASMLRRMSGDDGS